MNTISLLKKNSKFLLFCCWSISTSCHDNNADNNTKKNKDTTIHEITDTPINRSDSVISIGFTKPVKILANDTLKNLIGENILGTEKVDFTGDGQPDFICKGLPDSLGIANEYWVSAVYKIIKRTTFYTNGFHYRWFINLDADPEPEMFEAVGDEESADYTLVDQNLETGKDQILLHINPVLKEKGINYWGYPWDITDIIVRKVENQIQIKCSLNHQIQRDDNNDTILKKQHQLPVIFFKGHTTQPDMKIENIQNEHWLSLKEIIDRTVN